MQRLHEFLYTFHALCLGAIALGLLIFSTGLIPNYAYYFVLQSTFVFLIIALGLSVYFNKSKLFVLLLFPLFFNLSLAFPSTLFTKLSSTAFWYITPLTLCLGYLFLYTLQERGLFSSFGLLRSSIGLAILTGSFFLLKNFSPQVQKALESDLLHVSLKALFKAPDFVVIISLIALVFIFFVSLLFEVNTQKAPFWMLLAQLIPTLWLQDKNSFILFSLIASLIAIAALIHDAYRMAYIDTLTGVPGRRALEESFLRLGSRYTIAMVDIDHFKKFNDRFGHDVGDEVLKLVATILATVKNRGKVYRYGGEEFTILFHSNKQQECVLALEEIREKIFARGFAIRDKNRPPKAPKKGEKETAIKKERLSVSIGVATSRKNKTPHEIVKLADEALYKAKESGRNCLISH